VRCAAPWAGGGRNSAEAMTGHRSACSRRDPAGRCLFIEGFDSGVAPSLHPLWLMRAGICARRIRYGHCTATQVKSCRISGSWTSAAMEAGSQPAISGLRGGKSPKPDLSASRSRPVRMAMDATQS
jgi:hypothetical protein